MELVLGETILSKGGTTAVPQEVVEKLSLVPKQGNRSKLLWTQAGQEVVVTKGTPQSDWRKTLLRRNGTTSIPKHIQQTLNLETTHHEEKVLWILRNGQVTVRKGT